MRWFQFLFTYCCQLLLLGFWHPSTYIPDQISFYEGLNLYIFVGGDRLSLDGKCGYAEFYCTAPSYGVGSHLVASLSYIPDWFRKWIDILAYPYCKGANTHDVAVGPHAIQMDIGTHFAAWTVGIYTRWNLG